MFFPPPYAAGRRVCWGFWPKFFFVSVPRGERPRPINSPSPFVLGPEPIRASGPACLHRLFVKVATVGCGPKIEMFPPSGPKINRVPGLVNQVLALL